MQAKDNDMARYASLEDMIMAIYEEMKTERAAITRRHREEMIALKVKYDLRLEPLLAMTPKSEPDVSVLRKTEAA